MTQLLSGHSRAVYDLAWSADGKKIATASSDGTVRIWSLADGSCQQTLQIHEEGVLAVAYSADGSMLAVGPRRGAHPSLRNPEDGSLLRELQVPGKAELGDVNSLAFSPDSTLLAAATEAGVMLWQVVDGTMLAVGLHGSEVYGVAWSPDAKLLASCSWDGTVRFWGIPRK